MSLVDSYISYLSGFLSGLASIDGAIREKCLNVFDVSYNSNLSLEENFFTFYPELNGLGFTSSMIEFGEIESLIQGWILRKPLGLELDVTDWKSFLAFRIMDYLSWCFSDDVDCSLLDVYSAELTEKDGVKVKYLIIPHESKALYILFQNTVTIEGD
ncbi:hypothetical protein [Acinetobacter entericus]|uniref:Uncharacterized protein n=1 Tax=Acinetobacter entericus TaxID=2989714 RepID=A0ABT3NNT4_9GAMM|nr:hypothetical protein [Acinetobacter entericus]MCW8041224.1 hypothetical protein [Acinetobacter entericus]